MTQSLVSEIIKKKSQARGWLEHSVWWQNEVEQSLVESDPQVCFPMDQMWTLQRETVVDNLKLHQRDPPWWKSGAKGKVLVVWLCKESNL